MATKSRILGATLILLLAFGATACPTGAGDPAEFQITHMGIFFAMAFGLMDAAEIGIPLTASSSYSASIPLGAEPLAGEYLEFNGFQEESGWLAIHMDADKPPTWVFPITGQGNEGCVDFGEDGCDAGDVGLTYVPVEHVIRISSPFPAGQLLGGELYSLTFKPGIFTDYVALSSNLSEFRVRYSSANGPVELTGPFLSGLVGFLTTLPTGTAQSLQVTSTLVVTNPGPVAAGCLVGFFAPDGKGQTFRIGGETTNLYRFSLPAGGTVRLPLTPSTEGDFATGWGFLGANVPGVTASVVYTTRDGGGRLLGEAGVSSTRAGFRHSLSVAKGNGRDTALAVANPTRNTAELSLSLRQGKDEIATGNLSVPPFGQTARFFSELVDPGQESFEGTLVIETDSAVAVNTLHTEGGFQTSSLEAGSR